MAITLSSDLLVELGYEELTASQARELLADLYDAMERMVGVALADEMSEQQLDAFEAFYDANDGPGALAWLRRNFPDYRERVREVFEELKETLRATARGDRATGYEPGEPRGA